MKVELSFGTFNPVWENVFEAQVFHELRQPTKDHFPRLYGLVTGIAHGGNTLIRDKLAVAAALKKWVMENAASSEDTQVMLASRAITKDGPKTTNKDYPLMSLLADSFTERDRERAERGKLSLWNLAERLGLMDVSLEILAEMYKMRDDVMTFEKLIYGET